MENLQKALNLTLEVIRSMQFSNTPAIFERHFKNLKVAKLDENGVLIVIAPDDQVNTLNSRFRWMLLSPLQSASSVAVTDLLFVSAEEYKTAVASDTPDNVSPLPEDSEDISDPLVSEMSPLLEVVSSLTVREEESGDEADNLEIEMTWSGDYDQVVQPEKVITVPRYFLRHIAHMGAENAWMYIGFRQAAYRAGQHYGNRKVEIASRQIARWAGIHQVTFWRRIAKPETWTALKGFVSKGKPGDWQQGKDTRPHQAPNSYQVSMTIPLTPADVCTLRSYLINLAEECGIEAAVDCALAVAVEELLPPSKGEANCDPMTVYELVKSLGGKARSASALQSHIIQHQDVVVLTQYFVETWLPRLNEAASWMIAWMRDTCDSYGNIRASVQDIMDLTGVSRERTVRDWLRNEEVGLFIKDHPDSKLDKARGLTAKRSFLIRQDEPLEHELGAIVTHRNGSSEKELVADATHRNDSGSKELVAVVKNELVADATHRKNSENDELVAVATHRRAKSKHNWSLLQYQLVANATVKALINKESFIKLINVKSSTYLNLINSINKRGAKNFENENPTGPDSGQEGDRQLEVEDVSKSDFPEVDQSEKKEIQEEGSAPVQPDEDSAEDQQLVVEDESETESIDPQVLFEDILKRADASLKIRRQLKGKPFYPFLCWLIQGASRDKIDDPVAFAISRYDNGLPADENIRGLAYDPDELLDNLEDSVERWMVSPLLRRVFGDRLPRVKLLAHIMGVEDAA